MCGGPAAEEGCCSGDTTGPDPHIITRPTGQGAGGEGAGLAGEPQPFIYVLGDGRRIAVSETPERGIGWQLWHASSHLADYLTSHPQLVAGQSVLELGAGCGLCGMAAGAIGARRVRLTDMAEVLPSLQANVDANSNLWATGGCAVRCNVVDWNSEASETPCSIDLDVDVILISDCTYWQHLFVPLVRTVLLNVRQHTAVVLAHKWRRPEVEEEVFSLFLDHFETSASHVCSDDTVTIICLRLRDGMDLGATQRGVLCSIESEAGDVQALLSRLDAIERDMSSISI